MLVVGVVGLRDLSIKFNLFCFLGFLGEKGLFKVQKCLWRFVFKNKNYSALLFRCFIGVLWLVCKCGGLALNYKSIRFLVCLAC